MKLDGKYRYVVLCEDAQMKSFVVSFLRCNKIDPRRIIVRNYPCGEGCGEAFVRKEYLREVKLLRTMNYIRSVLVVCTDADSKTVDQRMSTLDDEISVEIKRWKREDEPIILFIPKRQIETWIRFLNGETVDEEMRFIHSGKPVSCKKEAEQFALFCQSELEIDTGNISSLSIAKEEYVHVCEMQLHRKT